jgi:hypothetical protein
MVYQYDVEEKEQKQKRKEEIAMKHFGKKFSELGKTVQEDITRNVDFEFLCKREHINPYK